ncbi:MAG: type VI secretion system protein TssA [Verrucomicrobia bacterium]|nr:type VI secretion system protein TssA [Verrucomicrobiota bacterium]
MISVEELLQPISEDAPCGEDLSYDVALQELENSARGKPETQFSAAEPPEWKQVAKDGLELFSRSKDLRVALTLTVAWLELEGLPGFQRGIGLMAGLLETYWAAVHPQLDPADDNDPLQRMNIVASLTTPVGTYGDPYRVLERLRAAPLTDSMQMGRLTLADLLRAESGAPAAGGAEQRTPAQVEAAFRDTSPEFLAQNYYAVTAALALVKELDDYLTNIVGASNAPDLSALSSELTAVQKRIAPYFEAAGAAAAMAETAIAAGEIGGPAVAVAEVPGAFSVTGEIRSREEVLRLLDRISQYYAKYEPSSPVPLILKRAARLAAMDFMQIIADLTPDSATQIRTITGEPEPTPE